MVSSALVDRPPPPPTPNPPRAMEPDWALLEAMREVDALTPACPPIAPPSPLDLTHLRVPDAAAAEVRPAIPAGLRAKGQPYTIATRPPPPAPMPTRAPGPGIVFGARPRPIPPAGRTRLGW